MQYTPECVVNVFSPVNAFITESENAGCRPSRMIVNTELLASQRGADAFFGYFAFFY
jgi:hypothetical protein